MNNLTSLPKRALEYIRWNSCFSKKYNIWYVVVPKVACTSIKWWFAETEANPKNIYKLKTSGEVAIDLLVHSYLVTEVARHITGLDDEHLLQIINSDTCYRFALVRNPIKRIFSAWHSKILTLEPLQTESYRGLPFLDLSLESVDDIRWGFEAFLEHVLECESSEFPNPHWAPQYSLLRPDLIPYTKVIKIENSDELIRDLVKHTGVPDINPLKFRKNESLIPYHPDLITDRARNILFNLYEQDFREFGYDFSCPPPEKFFSSEEYKLALKFLKMLRSRHTRIGQLYSELKCVYQDLNLSSQELDVTKAELTHTTQQLQTTQQELDATKANLSHTTQQLQTTQQELDATKANLSHTTQQLQLAQQELDAAKAQLSYINQELEWFKQEVARIKGSRFWKVWQVLRKVKKSVMGVFQPRIPDAQK